MPASILALDPHSIGAALQVLQRTANPVIAAVEQSEDQRALVERTNPTRRSGHTVFFAAWSSAAELPPLRHVRFRRLSFVSPQAPEPCAGLPAGSKHTRRYGTLVRVAVLTSTSPP